MKLVSLKWILFIGTGLLSFNLSAGIAPSKKVEPSKDSYKSSYKKFWHWSFFSVASESSEGLTNGYGGLFSYNYFKAKHYLNKSSAISLVPTFFISTPGRKTETAKVSEGAIEVGDLYSEYQYSAYANTFLKTKVGVRVYLPLSLSSKKNNLKTRGQLYATISAHPFYKVQAYYKVEANSYAYKDKTFVNKNLKTVGKKNSKFYHFLTLSYLTSEAFSISSGLGQELSLYEETLETDSSRMVYSAEMNVKWNMAHKVSISLGLKNKITRNQNWTDLAKLNTSEVVVMTRVAF